MNVQVISLFLRRLFRDRAVWALPVSAFAVSSALTLGVVGGVHFFWTLPGDEAGAYRLFSGLALALLVLPLASLAGASARLLARRRDERLSSLRLVGASRGTLMGLAVAEATALAAAGAVVGVAGYAALMPLIALLPFAGGRVGVAPQWIGVPGVLGVVAGLVGIAALSALTGLRRVAITPLGVRTRQEPERVRWVRVLAVVAILAAAQLMIVLAQGAADMAVALTVVVVALAVPLFGLHLLGPWVLRAGARLRLRRARTVESLVAARSVLESPRQAWRQVGALSVTTYVGVIGGAGLGMVATAGGTQMEPADALLMQDLRTGVLLTMVISFLLAACSVAVNQSAQVVDRAELYRGLAYAGMPLRRMHAMRRSAVMTSLGSVLVLSLASAMVTAAPLIGGAVFFAPVSLAVVAACLAAGVLLIRVGVDVTRPALRRAVAVGA